MQSDQVLVEPVNSLQESFLFSKSLNLVACVATDTESMGNTREQVNLVWLLCFDQEFLRLVTLFGREYLVGLGGGY